MHGALAWPLTGAPDARLSPEGRISELEKKLDEQAVALESLRSALTQEDAALDAQKRGYCSRLGGKKTQRAIEAQHPKLAPGRTAGHWGCRRQAATRVYLEVLVPPAERCPDRGSNVERLDYAPEAA